MAARPLAAFPSSPGFAAAPVSAPFVVARGADAPVSTPSWLAPHDARDVRLLRWSAAPESRPETAAPLRSRSLRPSAVVVPDNVDVVEVRVPTPPAVPSFDGSAFAREIETLTATFAEATASIHAETEAYRAELRAACEREAVKLAFVIAERVVRSELATRPEIALAWAREATETLASEGTHEIRVGSGIAELLHDGAVVAPVHADPTLGEMEVRVTGERGFVDAGLTTRLRAIFEDVVESGEGA